MSNALDILLKSRKQGELQAMITKVSEEAPSLGFVLDEDGIKTIATELLSKNYKSLREFVDANKSTLNASSPIATKPVEQRNQSLTPVPQNPNPSVSPARIRLTSTQRYDRDTQKAKEKLEASQERDRVSLARKTALAQQKEAKLESKKKKKAQKLKEAKEGKSEEMKELSSLK